VILRTDFFSGTATLTTYIVCDNFKILEGYGKGKEDGNRKERVE